MSEKNNQFAKNEIYAALKLIQNLYKQGKVKKHIFNNILEEYSEYIDISNFR